MTQHDDDDAVESSLEELIQKKAAERPLEEADDDVLDLDQAREEQPGADTLIVKALPQQANEFTCSRCFLVKHQSQLADKRKGVCRDCA